MVKLPILASSKSNWDEGNQKLKPTGPVCCNEFSSVLSGYIIFLACVSILSIRSIMPMTFLFAFLTSQNNTLKQYPSQVVTYYSLPSLRCSTRKRYWILSQLPSTNCTLKSKPVGEDKHAVLRLHYPKYILDDHCIPRTLSASGRAFVLGIGKFPPSFTHQSPTSNFVFPISSNYCLQFFHGSSGTEFNMIRCCFNANSQVA